MAKGKKITLKKKSVSNIDKRLNKFKNANTEKFMEGIKDKKVFLNAPIIFSVIFILSLIGIIYYLTQLKNCVCFQKRNEENKTSLNYLIIIDILLLIFYILVFFLLVFSKNSKSMSGGGSSGNILKNVYYGIIISVIILIVLTMFFINYVYRLSLSVDPDCECSNSKLKYLLYGQAVLSILFLIGLFVGIYNVNVIYGVHKIM